MFENLRRSFGEAVDREAGRRMAAADWPLYGGRGGATTDPTFVEVGDFNAFPSSIYTQANRLGVLFAIIKLLVEAVVPLPRAVYRGLERVADHPLNLLLVRPFSQYDGWLGYEYPIRAMLTQGNGYWIIRRGRSGAPVDLIPAVEGGAYYSEDGPRRYSLSSIATGYPGALHDLPARDVVALHWHGFSGLHSPSPIGFAARQQISIMRATLTHLDAAARRAAQGGPVIKHTTAEAAAAPNPGQIRAALAALEEGYAATVQARKIPVLPPGLEGGRVPGLDQADALALDILRWTVEDLARIYSVSPGRLGQMSGGGAGVRTQAYQDQVSDFAHFAAEPIARRVDMAMTATLLTLDEQADGLAVRSDMTAASLGSPADLARLGVQLVGGGTHTPNEVRERYHGDPPHPEGNRLSAPRGAAAPGRNDAPEGGEAGGDPGESGDPE